MYKLGKVSTLGLKIVWFFIEFDLFVVVYFNICGFLGVF